MISSNADKRNTKRAVIIAAAGILAALAVAGLCACAAAKPKPPKSGVWYKDIAASYLGVDLGSTYDYTELAKQIPQIEPAERAELLSIPEEKLAAMTTEELLVTCLDYPLFWDIFAYSTPEMGFKSIYRRYNGLQALLERDDAGEVLTAFYSHIDPEQVPKTDEFGTLRLEYLKLIIEHDAERLWRMIPEYEEG